MRVATLLIVGLTLGACDGSDAPAEPSPPSPSAEPRGPAVEPTASPSGRSLGSAVEDLVDQARDADFDRRLLGKWRIEQWGVSYEIRLDHGRPVVTGQDYVNHEAFEVSEVRWEPPVLHATFRMPSTNHTTRSQLRVLDDDHLEDTYSGAAAGVDVWERVP